MATCKAAVFVGAGKPLEVQDFPVPTLEPGATLIKMEMAAICGTDVHAAHLPESPAPVIFGHENVGSIAEMNGGPTRDVLGETLKVGDRVIFRSAPCGKCFNCAQGEACSNSRSYGMALCDSPPHLRGGFGQYLYLDPNPWLLKVPDDMPTERALLAVVGNHTLMNGLERVGGINAGDTVVIQGSGPIGMGALNQSRFQGAGRVIVLGAPDTRLALAGEMGADETVSIETYRDPAARVQRVLELTGGRGADVVIECSGAATAFQEGMEMCRYGGKFLVVGQWTDYGPQPINPSMVTRKSLRINGVFSGAPRHIIRSLQAMHRGMRYPVEKLITHRLPLVRINEGFAAHERLEAMIPVVLPNG
jgi:threonine dehydrogenase-like Zn-dependent dehydrogenase